MASEKALNEMNLRADFKILLADFSAVLLEKMMQNEEKRSYGYGWQENDWKEELQTELLNHVKKGDPRDVAIYALFAWWHSWQTANPAIKQEYSVEDIRKGMDSIRSQEVMFQQVDWFVTRMAVLTDYRIKGSGQSDPVLQGVYSELIALAERCRAFGVREEKAITQELLRSEDDDYQKMRNYAISLEERLGIHTHVHGGEAIIPIQKANEEN